MKRHSTAPINTFILRFWQEWSTSGPHWRGRISHVLSGDSAMFTSLEDMNKLILRFIAIPEKETHPGDFTSSDTDRTET